MTDRTFPDFSLIDSKALCECISHWQDSVDDSRGSELDWHAISELMKARIDGSYDKYSANECQR